MYLKAGRVCAGKSLAPKSNITIMKTKELKYHEPLARNTSAPLALTAAYHITGKKTNIPVVHKAWEMVTAKMFFSFR